jgi:glycine/sarcosine N-methyltransferase
VNWQNRLSVELPFLIEQLQQIAARSVLDAATGTGMHAIALAQLGYHAAGADISSGMIAKARHNATSAEVTIRFEVSGFTTLAQTFGPSSSDAVLCLGNSLPHLLSPAELSAALFDFAACLKPGGLLIIQNRNFDAILAHHDRWMEPQSHSEGDTDWIFQRFYDFNPDGLLTFNMITLKRVSHGSWSQKVDSSRLRPLLKDEIITALSSAGFESSKLFGNMSGMPFDPDTSPNLILLSHLPS